MTMQRRALLGLGILALCGAPAAAGRGAGELSLDRAAVTALLDAGMPRALSLSLPGIGDVDLRLAPPSRVDFVDGGVEAMVRVSLAGLRYATPVHVRYAPGIEPLSGVLLLEPESAEPELLPPFPLDLAALLPSVPLPRGQDWLLPGLAGRPVHVRLHVQGLLVQDDRLVLQLRLLTDDR